MITIPPDGPEAEDPFHIGETLTVVEAALVYAGRHPHSKFVPKDTPLDKVERWIGTNPLSRDVYHTILERIGRGAIVPVKSGYLDNGKINPRATVIRTADLAAIARERGDAAINLEPPLETRTGFPGRPTKGKGLIDAEFDRRAERGVTLPTLESEAQALLDWFAATHPERDRPERKTIQNNIRDKHRKIVTKAHN